MKSLNLKNVAIFCSSKEEKKQAIQIFINAGLDNSRLETHSSFYKGENALCFL
jgi:hypothetical protein